MELFSQHLKTKVMGASQSQQDCKPDHSLLPVTVHLSSATVTSQAYRTRVVERTVHCSVDITRLLDEGGQAVLEQQQPAEKRTRKEEKREKRKVFSIFHGKLVSTERGTPLLDMSTDRIFWQYLCLNPSISVPQLQNIKYGFRIDWESLSQNPAVNLASFSGSYPIRWAEACLNPRFPFSNAAFMSRHQNDIRWDYLCENTNFPFTDTAFMDRHADNIVWNLASSNKSLPLDNAVFVEKYVDKINWFLASSNPRLPADEAFLHRMRDRLNWGEVAANITLTEGLAAIFLLEPETMIDESEEFYLSLLANPSMPRFLPPDFSVSYYIASLNIDPREAANIWFRNPRVFEGEYYRYVFKVSTEEQQLADWRILSANPSLPFSDADFVNKFAAKIDWNIAAAENPNFPFATRHDLVKRVTNWDLASQNPALPVEDSAFIRAFGAKIVWDNVNASKTPGVHSVMIHFTTGASLEGTIYRAHTADALPETRIPDFPMTAYAKQDARDLISDTDCRPGSGGFSWPKIIAIMGLQEEISRAWPKELECSVCLEPIEEKRDSGMIVPCGHAFHKTCILRWMEESDLCPICRGEIMAFIAPEQVHRLFHTEKPTKTARAIEEWLSQAVVFIPK